MAIWKLGSKDGLKKHGSKTHDVYDTPQSYSFYSFFSSQFKYPKHFAL